MSELPLLRLKLLINLASFCQPTLNNCTVPNCSSKWRTRNVAPHFSQLFPELLASEFADRGRDSGRIGALPTRDAFQSACFDLGGRRCRRKAPAGFPLGYRALADIECFGNLDLGQVASLARFAEFGGKGDVRHTGPFVSSNSIRLRNIISYSSAYIVKLSRARVFADQGIFMSKTGHR